jgi:hypothetical protein
MAGDAVRPLSTEEAKTRLRAAAQQASPSAWVRRHPLSGLTIALLCGFLAAHLRTAQAGGSLLAHKLVLPLFIAAARRK